MNHPFLTECDKYLSIDPRIKPSVEPDHGTEFRTDPIRGYPEQGVIAIPFDCLGMVRGYVMIDTDGVVKDIQFYINCFHEILGCYTKEVKMLRNKYLGTKDNSLVELCTIALQ